MRILANVYNAYRSMMTTRQDMKTWSESNSQMWRIIGHVERLRADNG